MTVIKEYIKSEDVIRFLAYHKYDWGKGKYIEELIDEFIEKVILEKYDE